VKQLEDGYVRFVALSFFFLYAKFCPLWCRHVKITANDKVGRFLGHSVYCLCTITVASVMGLKLSNVQCSISNMTFLWQFPALCENLSFLSLLAHSKLPVWLYTTSRLVSYPMSPLDECYHLHPLLLFIINRQTSQTSRIASVSTTEASTSLAEGKRYSGKSILNQSCSLNTHNIHLSMPNASSSRNKPKSPEKSHTALVTGTSF